LPLAQLASTIAEAATYDPKNDPRVIEARANKLKINQAADAATAARQERDMFNDPTIPLGDIASHALAYGHAKPEDAGKLALLAAAARGVAPGKSMDDALSGMGLYELASGTPGGSTFNASTYTSRMKPTEVLESGKPVLRAAQDSYGSTPVLSDANQKGLMLGNLAADAAHPMSRAEQLAAVGAQPNHPDVYSYLGPNGEKGTTTDPAAYSKPGWMLYKATVQSADPNGLTTGVKTDVQKAQLGLQNFRDLVGMARSVATKDPTLFGVTGEARRFGQEVAQQLGNVKLMSSGEKAGSLDNAYQDAMAQMAANGITIPGMEKYDPNLSDIAKLSVLLRYAGAAALAGQQGRSVSNEDVKTFANVVGDPRSFLSSQQQYLSGLDLMDRIANNMAGRNAGALGDVAAGAATPPGAGAPAAPAAAPAPAPAAPPPAGGPQKGAIEDGYEFLGGDPANQANWRKVN
jgi:hypothetical protein